MFLSDKPIPDSVEHHLQVIRRQIACHNSRHDDDDDDPDDDDPDDPCSGHNGDSNTDKTRQGTVGINT